MSVAIRVVGGALLVAHGLVHLLFVAEDVQEFTFEDSWLLAGAVARTVGLVFMAGAIGAFALVGLAVWGVPGLASHWSTLMIVGAVVSLALLVAFWHTRMVLGVAINLALIALAVGRPDWWSERVG